MKVKLQETGRSGTSRMVRPQKELRRSLNDQNIDFRAGELEMLLNIRVGVREDEAEERERNVSQMWTLLIR